MKTIKFIIFFFPFLILSCSSDDNEPTIMLHTIYATFTGAEENAFDWLNAYDFPEGTGVSMNQIFQIGSDAAIENIKNEELENMPFLSLLRMISEEEVKIVLNGMENKDFQQEWLELKEKIGLVTPEDIQTNITISLNGALLFEECEQLVNRMKNYPKVESIYFDTMYGLY